MTKKELTERCRTILSNHQFDESIRNESDLEFLYLLFENHPEWEQTKGVGIKFISVIKTTYGNLCFQLNRLDNSFTDISSTKCITNPSKISEIKRACRNAISDEIKSFRKNNVVFGVTTCTITNEVLFESNTHINHYDMTFNEMFNIWFKDKDEDFYYKKINKTKDNCIDTYFTDKEIISDFKSFHNANCKLRAVTKLANLSILK